MIPIELAPLTVLPDSVTTINISTGDSAGQDDNHDLDVQVTLGTGVLTVEKLDRRVFKLTADWHQTAHSVSVKLAATNEVIAHLPVNVDDQRVVTVSYTVEP